MSLELLVDQHLEFLSLTGGCTGSSESTLVKLPHCWKSHVTAHLYSSALIQCTVPVIVHRSYQGVTCLSKHTLIE